MIKCRKSKISAHHNYLVNNMLTPGFVVGDPNSHKGFYFLADLVLPGESTPRISARLPDNESGLFLELNWNRIRENPAGYSFHPTSGGFKILRSSGESLLEVRTQGFANGYLTLIKARVLDEHGNIRMEALGESVRVHGKATLVLESPFSFSTR